MGNTKKNSFKVFEEKLTQTNVLFEDPVIADINLRLFYINVKDNFISPAIINLKHYKLHTVHFIY